MFHLPLSPSHLGSVVFVGTLPPFPVYKQKHIDMLYELLDLNGCCESVALPSVVAPASTLSPLSSGRSSPVQSTSAAATAESNKKKRRQAVLAPPPKFREGTDASAAAHFPDASLTASEKQISPPPSEELPTRKAPGPRGGSPVLAGGELAVDLWDSAMRSGARSPAPAPILPYAPSSVVLGRHTMLPSACRLAHVAISRQHVRIDCVGLPPPPAKTAFAAKATRGRKKAAPEPPPAATNIIPLEPSPYMLTVLGRNTVYVNGAEIARGEPFRLHINDTLSFLEDAFDPEAGIFQPSAGAGTPPLGSTSTARPPTVLARLLQERQLLPSKRPLLASDADATPSFDFSPLQRSASTGRHRNPLPVFMLRRRGGSPTVGTRGSGKLQQLPTGPESSTSSDSVTPRSDAKPKKAKRRRRN